MSNNPTIGMPCLIRPVGENPLPLARQPIMSLKDNIRELTRHANWLMWLVEAQKKEAGLCSMHDKKYPYAPQN